ncbi:MAG TPA: 2OG-Fe(II) oxygenase [Rhodanobacteraceae bacterium]
MDTLAQPRPGAGPGPDARAIQQALASGQTRNAVLRQLVASGWPQALAKTEVDLAWQAFHRPKSAAHGAQAKPVPPVAPVPAATKLDTHHSTNVIALPNKDVRVLFSAGKSGCHLTLFDGIATDAEIEHLIALARPRLQRSGVVADAPAQATDARRTSASCFLPLGCDAVVAGLEARMSALLGLPVQNGEGLQILHYKHAQEYQPHWDYFTRDTDFERRTLAVSGQRVGTLILYLSDVDEGGATYLPTLDVAVHPRLGMALWLDYLSAGKVDPRSLHGGTPILRGEKWIATKWFRERAYRG